MYVCVYVCVCMYVYMYVGAGGGKKRLLKPLYLDLQVLVS